MRLSSRAEGVVLPIAAVVLALLIGAVLIALDGANPFEAYWSLLQGAVGSQDAIARTLEKATPLIFTGLAVIVGMKAGLFNIGAQGQLLLGAVFAAWFGYRFELPTVLHVPLALVVGGLMGMLPARPGRRAQGVPRRPRGDHDDHAQRHPDQHHGVAGRAHAARSTTRRAARSPGPRRSAESAEIPRLFDFPSGFPLAVLVACLIWYLVGRTTVGFKLTTVGQNKHAARYGGISAARITVLAMAISGFLAGVGGAIETLGVFGRYESGRNAGLGFDGITVALLARINPILAIPSALLLGGDARRPDEDGVRRQGRARDHRRDPGDHPAPRVRPDRRALAPAAAPARRRGAINVQLTSGWGS